MKSIFEQNGGTYTQAGDYLIPDISLPDAPAYPIGKYGRMRVEYLKEHRPGLYTRLTLSGKLHEHLAEVERTCKERLDTMIPQMAKAQGVTEAMKARDVYIFRLPEMSAGFFISTINRPPHLNVRE